MSNYPTWLIGALLAEIMVMRKWRPSLLRGLIGVAITMALLVATKAVPNGFTRVTVLCAMAMGTCAVIAFEAMPAAVLSSWPGRALEWLGVRSYSLYVFHTPLVVFAGAWMFAAEGARPAHGWYALLALIITLSISVLWFNAVERRFMPKRLEVKA
jgi:peptidoglycan/LPS O-acetylase OafA/YrhL